MATKNDEYVRDKVKGMLDDAKLIVNTDDIASHSLTWQLFIAFLNTLLNKIILRRFT